MYHYPLIQAKAREHFNWALAIFWLAALVGLAYCAVELIERFNSLVRAILK